MRKRTSAAIRLQASARQWAATKNLRRVRAAVLLVQRVARGRAVRRRLGDFRAIKDARDADRKREKLRQEREQQQLRDKAAELEKKEQEMAARLEAMEAAKLEEEKRRAEMEEDLKRQREERERRVRAAVLLVQRVARGFAVRQWRFRVINRSHGTGLIRTPQKSHTLTHFSQMSFIHPCTITMLCIHGQRYVVSHTNM